MPTAKGHLDQEQKGLQSTKENFDIILLPIEQTYDCCATIVPFTQSNKAYMDLTGKFPHQSTRGNKYVLVVYDYDSNGILVEPLSSRQAGVIKDGW